jgi:hypothetical protein
LHIPIDKKILTLPDLPYTISYIIRKRQQVDNLMELPKEKRPPELTIWYGTTEDIEIWLDRVMGTKEENNTIMISEDEIER